MHASLTFEFTNENESRVRACRHFKELVEDFLVQCVNFVQYNHTVSVCEERGEVGYRTPL